MPVIQNGYHHAPRKHNELSSSEIPPELDHVSSGIELRDLPEAEASAIRSETGFEVQLKKVTLQEPDVEYGYEDSTGNELSDQDHLLFKDTKHKETALARLHTMRKNKELCDVVLFVQDREIVAHKTVLAAASTYFYTLFTSGCGNLIGVMEHQASPGSATASGAVDRTYYEFNESWASYETFTALVNYAYTSCLEVPPGHVKNVYKMASVLKMQSCAKACAKYLAARLTLENCIGIRKCANRASDQLLTNRVDDYIQQNISQITRRSVEFTSLPCVQVDVIVSEDGHEMLSTQLRDERLLAAAVMDWLQLYKATFPNNRELRMDVLTEKVHMLYLNDDLTLHDCCDADEKSSVGACEVIKDYKRSSKKQGTYVPSNEGSRRSSRASAPPYTPNAGVARIGSSDSIATIPWDEVDFQLIAIVRNSENYYLCLAVINRTLAALSIRLNESATGASSRNRTEASLLASANVSDSLSNESNSEIVPLATMMTPRCSVGAVNLDGLLVVCGGYDRGECLSSVEAYDPASNTWTSLPAMKKGRGRLDAAAWNGKIYAIGGSDGVTDLSCCECFDRTRQEWTNVASLNEPISNTSCAVVNGFVYSIGGWSGQNATKECSKFDVQNGVWLPIKPMGQSRSQAGVAVWHDRIIVVGGCDNWQCLNTVELYDPVADSWATLPSMSVQRRGCGVAVVDNKLFVVGGSDGSQSLSSTEILCLNTRTWAKGPSLTQARANVRAVNINGRVYTVGGFGGKAFLNTMEFLDEANGEWRTFLTPAECLEVPFDGSTNANGQPDCIVNNHSPETV